MLCDVRDEIFVPDGKAQMRAGISALTVSFRGRWWIQLAACYIDIRASVWALRALSHGRSRISRLPLLTVWMLTGANVMSLIMSQLRRNPARISSTMSVMLQDRCGPMPTVLCIHRSPGNHSCAKASSLKSVSTSLFFLFNLE